MTRLLLLLAVICCCGNLTSFSQAPDKRFTGLDTAFARVLKDWHTAGFAVAVVEKNKVVYSKGFGYRDVEKKLPVTTNTLFAIGSCTKAFTSSLLGMLQKDGKLELDKPVRTYLPDLRFYNDAMNDMITVRDMMCHRTGLPRHDLSWYYFPTSRDSLITRIRYLEPTAGLREQYQYNNFMFLAQGVVAEKLYNNKWETLVKEKILNPLGMTQTNFSVQDMANSADAATGYYAKKDTLITKLDYFNIDAMGPAGSINSSVNEMANWVITWINGGKFNGKEILPPGYVPQAISGQMISGSGLPDKDFPDVHISTYGFGWGMGSYRGHYRVQHGGNIDGFSANVTFFPSDSVGIIVLVNQNASVVPSIVRNLVADRMLNLTRTDWNTFNKKAADKARAEQKAQEKNVTSSKKPNAPLTHPLKSYEGLYSHPGYGTIEVVVKNDSLFGLLPRNESIWFRHFHYDIFEFFGVDKTYGIDTTDKTNMKYQFNMNTMGDIESLSTEMQPGLKPLVFTRTPKAAPLTKADLQKYVGEYEIAGMKIKTEIRNENVLFFIVPGQPDYETVYVGNHEFKLKALEGFTVKFDVDAKNEVTSATFIQPNGIFKGKRIR
jgi:CubicO group peptidase (beta-lactamase class C family)